MYPEKSIRCRFIFPLFCGMIFFSLVLLVIHFGGRQRQPSPDSHNASPPTEAAMDIRSGKKKVNARREWFEQMHRAAPGVKWKRVDAATRQRKNRHKLEKRKGLLKTGLLERNTRIAETIADGRIVGEWQERGSDNLSGRIHTVDVDFDRGLMYAGSAGGNIWVGKLDGMQWKTINDYFRIEDILMVKLLPNGKGTRLVVVQGGWWLSSVAVFYSDNDGLTWHTATGLETIAWWGRLVRAVCSDENDPALYLLGSEWDYDNGHSVTVIYKSTDLGARFTRIHTFKDDIRLFDMWAEQTAPYQKYLLQGQRIYRFGESDQLDLISDEIAVPNAVQSTFLTGRFTKAGTFLYALFVKELTSHIYRSVDSGKTWTKAGKVDEVPFMRNSFACSIQDPLNVYLGCVDCYRSRDGGENWSKVNEWVEYLSDPESMLHADIPGIDVFVDPQGSEFALLSTDGGVYISNDHLVNVRNLSLTGLRISQYYSTFTPQRGTPILAGSQDQGFQITDDIPGRILDFQQTRQGDYGHLVSSNDGNSIWASYPGLVLFYPDDPRYTWPTSWAFRGSNYLWMPPLMVDPETPNQCYLGGGGTQPGAYIWQLKAANGQITAKEGTFDFSGNDETVKVSAMACSPFDSDVRYTLTTDGRFFHSLDSGQTWKPSQSFEGPGGFYMYGSCIVPSPTVPGRVYVGGSGYSNPAVYVSDDYGKTFTPFDTGLENTLVLGMAVTPDERLLFAATQVGPYCCFVKEGQWYDMAGISGPDQIYWSVEWVPMQQIARFSTSGRGIWDFQIQEFVKVRDDEKIVTPDGFKIFPNHPNPFNSQTRIAYYLPGICDVELQILNTAGQTVRHLFYGPQHSGRHVATWDGRNARGQTVPSGQYVYRLLAGRFKATGKMTLIR